MQRDLNKRLGKGNLSHEEEDAENSKKITERIAAMLSDGMVNVKAKQKYTEIVNLQDDDVVAANKSIMNVIVNKGLD